MTRPWNTHPKEGSLKLRCFGASFFFFFFFFFFFSLFFLFLGIVLLDGRGLAVAQVVWPFEFLTSSIFSLKGNHARSSQVIKSCATPPPLRQTPPGGAEQRGDGPAEPGCGPAVLQAGQRLGPQMRRHQGATKIREQKAGGGGGVSGVKWGGEERGVKKRGNHQ